MSAEGDTVYDDPVEFIVACKGGSLFHLTDERNLKSIRQHGLLSKQELVARRITPHYPGGSPLTRALDREYRLENYVFLGFSPSVVMPAHKEEQGLRRPIVLTIQAAILYRPDVRIALGRANHQGTRHYSVLEAVMNMERAIFSGDVDREDIKTRPAWNRVSNYEVMIPSCVPPQFIMQYEPI